MWFLCLLGLLSSLAPRSLAAATWADVCTLSPLGDGQDDTDQILVAVAECGQGGLTVFNSGDYNITRKMMWNLSSARVELHGYLNFQPNIQYWLNTNSTYRVVFIQDQASWFVISGNDFIIDAFNSGGIQGNGQPWWDYFTTVRRSDGDGRPISLTLYQVTRGLVQNFRIESPPFWCNAVAESTDVVYDGMLCNSTNNNPQFLGRNIVQNTDGIDTYRSDGVTLLNWDVTTGDDCLAFNGNTTNVLAHNTTCRGGSGIAFGSLGQYQFARLDQNDVVENVLLEDLNVVRPDPMIQPKMLSGVYFKTWDGTVNGVPPTGGGGGGGHVRNVVVRDLMVDNVTEPIHLFQTNRAESGDAPSKLQLSDLSFINVSGTAATNTIVNLTCSPAAPCPNITFVSVNVTPPAGESPKYICQNVIDEVGLPAPCNAMGAVWGAQIKCR